MEKIVDIVEIEIEVVIEAEDEEEKVDLATSRDASRADRLAMESKTVQRERILVQVTSKSALLTLAWCGRSPRRRREKSAT